MSVMAKKNPRPQQEPAPEPSEDPAPKQVNLRLFDAALLDAIEAYAADKYKRGNMRNYAINALLEEILKEKGYWPWPRDVEE
jgi:hypothetical protein